MIPGFICYTCHWYNISMIVRVPQSQYSIARTFIHAIPSHDVWWIVFPILWFLGEFLKGLKLLFCKSKFILPQYICSLLFVHYCILKKSDFGWMRCSFILRSNKYILFEHSAQYFFQFTCTPCISHYNMATKSSSVFYPHASQLRSASLLAITQMTRMPFYKSSFLTLTLNHPIATVLVSEGIGQSPYELWSSTLESCFVLLNFKRTFQGNLSLKTAVKIRHLWKLHSQISTYMN